MYNKKIFKKSINLSLKFSSNQSGGPFQKTDVRRLRLSQFHWLPWVHECLNCLLCMPYLQCCLRNVSLWMINTVEIPSLQTYCGGFCAVLCLESFVCQTLFCCILCCCFVSNVNCEFSVLHVVRCSWSFAVLSFLEINLTAMKGSKFSFIAFLKKLFPLRKMLNAFFFQARSFIAELSKIFDKSYLQVLLKINSEKFKTVS